jgi:hypothetical protein
MRSARRDCGRLPQGRGPVAAGLRRVQRSAAICNVLCRNCALLPPLSHLDALTRGSRPAHTHPMLARVRSASLQGIEAATVFVEVDVTLGLPMFTTDGLNTPTPSAAQDPGPGARCMRPWTLPNPGPAMESSGAMWCPWCGRRIKLGIVTPGGIVYHVWCWRRRAILLARE